MTQLRVCSNGSGRHSPATGMAGSQGQVYLITGGCGFLGKHLVKMLVEQGEGISEIRVFDLKVERELESLSTDSVTVRAMEGDVRDREELIRATQGVDVVMHLASIVDIFGQVPEAAMEEVNVQGTHHVIEACIANGVRRCVYTSSMEVVGPNTRQEPFIRGNEESKYNILLEVPYARTKAAAEKVILAANGMEVTDFNSERMIPWDSPIVSTGP
ncbi:3 beta-hydroxysteroid dehydrogenase type 7-like [Mustelus asterias]